MSCGSPDVIRAGSCPMSLKGRESELPLPVKLCLMASGKGHGPDI